MSSSQEMSGFVGNDGATHFWTPIEKRRTAISLSLLALLVIGAALVARRDGGSSFALSLLIGLSLGIIFERGRFCFYCIFKDSIKQKNSAPLLPIYVAIAVGSIGYSVVLGQFLPDARSGYLPPGAHIPPLSGPLLLAAFIFGCGMSLSGSCISGHIYRIGVGNIKSIPALAGVILGFVLAFKSWNFVYLSLISEAPTIWMPQYLGYAGSLAVTLTLVGYLIYRAQRSSQSSATIRGGSFAEQIHRLIYRPWGPVLTGSLVGIIGTIAYLRIEPLGVTRQLGTTARMIGDGYNLIPKDLKGLDVMSGCIAILNQVFTKNGWLILGITFGSFLSAYAGLRFKLTRISLRQTIASFLGGILLGWGSMIALGCTIGVLLSGTQAFALSGWAFFLFVYVGVRTGRRLGLHKAAHLGV